MTVAVKICGIKTPEALETAIGAGADYVGLVFFARSPRNLDLVTARKLRDHARRLSPHVKVVALVVDETDERLSDIAAEVDPDLFQLHGHESLERVEAIRAKVGRALIKAVPVATRADVEAARAYLAPGRLADILLFDAKAPPGAVLPGGNGLTFDWHILDGIAPDVAFALAGGLDPENVAAAAALTGASILDVSSGVETAPGVKSTELIRRFIQRAKKAKETA